MVYYKKILSVNDDLSYIFPGPKISILYKKDVEGRYILRCSRYEIIESSMKYRFSNFRPLFGYRSRSYKTLKDISLLGIDKYEMPICNPILQSKVDLQVVLGWLDD